MSVSAVPIPPIVAPPNAWVTAAPTAIPAVVIPVRTWSALASTTQTLRSLAQVPGFFAAQYHVVDDAYEL